VANASSFGQLQLPEASGFYWLRGYTLGSKAEAIVPITVKSYRRSWVVRKYRSPTSPPDNHIVSVQQKGDFYTIHLNDTLGFNYSIAIVKDENFAQAGLFSFPMKWEPIADTSFVAIQAKVMTKNGETLANQSRSLVAVFQQDTVVNSPLLLAVNPAGYVFVHNLYFFGDAIIRYQLNNDGKNAKEPVQLVPVGHQWPVFNKPPSSFYYEDTLQKDERLDSSDGTFRKAGYLQAVTVKSRWIDRHRGLNKKYIISPEFLPIEHFTYDLRDSALLMQARTVQDFVYRVLPQGWPRSSSLWDACDYGVQYYVDERLTPASFVFNQPLKQFAYAKVFQDLHPPCPCVCFWTRKGNDLEALPGQTKILKIHGFDKPLTWTTPDNTTYVWNPFVNQNDFAFSVSSPSFKVIIVGSTSTGQPFTFEKVVGAEMP
jgi:hypothetical protein